MENFDPLADIVIESPKPKAKDTPTARNPLLAKARLPGETFTLPSRGIFYNDDELAPNVKGGEVHVYPMTAIDEIIIRTPDKLFSGKAVEEIFGRCIPDVLKPMELLAKDVDFLLIALRKVSGYEEAVDIKYQHNCENSKEHTYAVPMSVFFANTVMLDPVTAKSAYTVKLPNGQTVILHPVRYSSVIDIMQAISQGKDLAELAQDPVKAIDSIVSLISSVDGVTDKDLIKEWVENIAVGWSRLVSEAIGKMGDFGPNMKSKIKCKDCGKEEEIDVPLNPISFFS